MTDDAFAVCVVSWGSASDLPQALAAVAALDPAPVGLVVADCGSSDDSLGVARRFAPPAVSTTVLDLGENRGFAGGMNAAIAATSAAWVLTLNPDAAPEPDYVRRLLERAGRHPELRTGALTGRLLRTERRGDQVVLDACGMRLTPTWRHLDRGSGEVDRGQYGRPERVFGATGAASLFRREALFDAAVDGEVFDSGFHSFREDAELCFRLRERGWEVLYEPTAVAWHRRFSTPARRRELPAAVNRHSLKNRYLLRLYHQRGGNLVLTLVPTLWRDALALGWALTGERSSLPAYAWLWRQRHEILRRRRAIQERRSAGRAAVEGWFWRTGAPLEEDGEG